MAGLYIEVSETLPKHPKTIRVARSLRVHPGMVVYHLITLWSWALKNAPSGDLSRFSSRDLSDAAEWTQAMDYSEDADTAAEAFISALKSCRVSDAGHGFLEVTADGKTLIHDWFEFGGKVMANRWKDSYRKRNSGRYPTESEAIAAGFPVEFGAVSVDTPQKETPSPRKSVGVPRKSADYPSVSNVEKRSVAERREEKHITTTLTDTTAFAGFDNADDVPNASEPVGSMPDPPVSESVHRQSQAQEKPKPQIVTRDSRLSCLRALPVRQVAFAEWFEGVFWKTYPRKESAPEAWKAMLSAFRGCSDIEALKGQVMDMLCAYRDCDQWTDPMMIPHPATWINRRPWEGDMPPSAARGTALAPAARGLRPSKAEEINSINDRAVEQARMLGLVK